MKVAWPWEIIEDSKLNFNMIRAFKGKEIATVFKPVSFKSYYWHAYNDPYGLGDHSNVIGGFFTSKEEAVNACDLQLKKFGWKLLESKHFLLR